MNNYEFFILHCKNKDEANKEVNDFIEDCNLAGVQILDIKSHFSEGELHRSFVFIFKLERKE